MSDETEFITKPTTTFWEKAFYWKLAIFKVVGKATMALLLSLVSSMNENEWANFSGTGKFIAVATAAGSAWLVIDAFLSDTISKLTAAQGTQTTQTTNTETVKVTTVPAAATPPTVPAP